MGPTAIKPKRAFWGLTDSESSAMCRTPLASKERPQVPGLSRFGSLILTTPPTAHPVERQVVQSRKPMPGACIRNLTLHMSSRRGAKRRGYRQAPLADGRLDVVVMRHHVPRPVMLEPAFKRELRSG